MYRSLLYLARPLSRASSRHFTRLANKPYLPGSEGHNFPQQLSQPRDDFPLSIASSSLGITSKATPSECAEAINDSLDELLLTYGAVLYSGFPINNAKEFGELFAGLRDYKGFDYTGGQAVRKNVLKNVYTASDEPGEYCIELHNEMAYQDITPDLVVFYCDVPVNPDCGGETCISDVRQILKMLDKSIVDKVEELGIMYHHHAPCQSRSHYRSWEQIFGTDNRDKVEKHLQAHQQCFRWEEDDALTWWWTRPAYVDHYKTGEKLWYNQFSKKHASAWAAHPQWQDIYYKKQLPMNHYPTHSLYGDGSEVDEDIIQRIRIANWTAAVGFQMQKGELLFMENYLVQHARLSFTGPRRLLAGLGARI